MPFIDRDPVTTHVAATFESQQLPGQEYLAEGSPDLFAFLNPMPTALNVVTERNRRLAGGFDYDFGDTRGVHSIGTTPTDMIGWDEVTKLALARHATGSTALIGIVTDTGTVEVRPAEWLAILEAANTFRQPIWHASFALQAMEPIPGDFADDSYWP